MKNPTKTIPELLEEYRAVAAELNAAVDAQDGALAWAAMDHGVQRSNAHRHMLWLIGKRYRITTIGQEPDPELGQPGWPGLRAAARMFADPKLMVTTGAFLGFMEGTPEGDIIAGRLLAFRLDNPLEPGKDKLIMAESDPLAVELLD